MQNTEQIILEKIRNASKSEWHYEKVNRFFNVFIKFGVWTSSIIILGLSTYQVKYITDITPNWLAISIVILATVNISFTVLVHSIRFEQRQIVHDRNAREYNAMENEYIVGSIKLEELVYRFNELYKKPVELEIKKTP